MCSSAGSEKSSWGKAIDEFERKWKATTIAPESLKTMDSVNITSVVQVMKILVTSYRDSFVGTIFSHFDSAMIGVDQKDLMVHQIIEAVESVLFSIVGNTLITYYRIMVYLFSSLNFMAPNLNLPEQYLKQDQEFSAKLISLVTLSPAHLGIQKKFWLISVMTFFWAALLCVFSPPNSTLSLSPPLS